MKLKLRTYQCGSPRKKGEGLRIGTVRFLPRGVKKKDYAKHDYFDVWLPTLAPSRELFKKGKEWDSERFLDRYEKELKDLTVARQSVLLLAEISKRTPIAIGCYCQPDEPCHRFRLEKVIHKAAQGKWLR